MTDRIPPYGQRHMDAAEQAIRDKTDAFGGMLLAAACALLAKALADIEELRGLACPDCKTPTLTLDGESIPPGKLRCACCGDDFDATPAMIEQAGKADAAYLAIEGGGS